MHHEIEEPLNLRQREVAALERIAKMLEYILEEMENHRE